MDYSTCRDCGVRLDVGRHYCGGGKCINMARETDDYRSDVSAEEEKLFTAAVRAAERMQVGPVTQLRKNGQLIGIEKDGTTAMLESAFTTESVANGLKAAIAEVKPKRTRKVTPAPKPGKKVTMSATVEVKKEKLAKVSSKSSPESSSTKPAKAMSDTELQATIDSMAQSPLLGLVSEDKKGLGTILPILLSEIEDFPAGDPPSRSFVESVRLLGVTLPIVVREVGIASNRFEIVEGRRRVAAARLAGMTTIPALIEHRDDADDDVTALALNRQRSANLIDQHRHVMNLLAKGHAVKTITSATGMTEHEVTRARDVGKLRPELIEAVESGAMAAHATRHAAMMSASDQGKLVEILNAEGRVTARDVTAVRRARQYAAVASVAKSLGGEMPDLPMPEEALEAKYAEESAAKVEATAPKRMSADQKMAEVYTRLKGVEELMTSIKKRTDDQEDILNFAREALDRFTPIV